MKKKTIAVGNSSFTALIEDNHYYVDKTACFKPLIESGNFVDLITRPRRFGKTLFMDSIRLFLAIDPANPGNAAKQERLFKDLKVAEDQDFCREYMGQVPVLFLSLKDVEGATFEAAYRVFASKIVVSAKRHAYLLDSPRLDDDDKALLRKYQTSDVMRDLANIDIAADFLKNMLTFLAKHFDRQGMLFLDEYDVPLAKAASRGYYNSMRDFMRAFFAVLKPEADFELYDRPFLKKAVLTGCLRVSKESIFTGVNNFSINTICSENVSLSACMGFTEPEVRALLDYYGMSSRKQDVKHWYDGYRFGTDEIFSPWNVLNFCQCALKSTNPLEFEPDNYWIGTSSNDVIDEFLGFLTEKDAERMQTLIDGGNIELGINEELNYSDISRHKSEDFWTLLLFTGYLTIAKPVGCKKYLLRIPNEEIRNTFRSRVQARFSGENSSFAAYGLRLAEAAATGDAPGMAKVLEPLLRTYISARDPATRAPGESCYDGFLSALFSCAGSRIDDFQSNYESGDGYADIVFSSGFSTERVGIVIEIKRASRPEGLLDSVNSALKQIDEKDYAECFRRMRCSKYYAYGIAFCGKQCEVGGGKLRDI